MSGVMGKQLDGKVAVITGAASGIGLATVELFVEAGARVMAADVNADEGQALADRFPGVPPSAWYADLDF